MSSLAILGGQPVRQKEFNFRTTIRQNEIDAVTEVMKTGQLSGFFGSPGPFWLGGPKVKEFEKKWAEMFGYKHAISVNSWTTGLMCCVGAAGIGPGDEVICPPVTMSATSTSVLFYGGIPVFADLDPNTYCLDPAAVEKKITPRTKAIMVVHLFGYPADMDGLIALAQKHNLKIIEDAAHAPLTLYKGKKVGALGHIGGFSLNYHKHIHTGEGGVIVTNDDEMAKKCQLIRNHGENLTEFAGVTDLTNAIGSNYRLTEIQAAIGLEQLKAIPHYVSTRFELADYMNKRLSNLKGIRPPKIEKDSTHAYYLYPITFDAQALGISREVFCAAVNKEFLAPKGWEQTVLVPGYVKPLYLAPVYQQKIAIGSKGFPFNYNDGVTYDYSKGICPVAEHMFEKAIITTPIVREPLTIEDMNDVADAIEKVVTNAHLLKDYKI